MCVCGVDDDERLRGVYLRKLFSGDGPEISWPDDYDSEESRSNIRIITLYSL
jgi:hypothetical protein